MGHPIEIKITVNEKEVVMQQHEATGVQIKDAAIAQGVNIKADFVLSEELGERRSRVIGDAQTIPIRDGQKFIAVAPDDNS